MEKPLYVFEPLSHGFDTWLVGSLFLALASAAIYFWFQKKTKLDANRRAVVAMAAAFVGFVAFGTVVFRLYSSYRLQPVRLFNDRIETLYGVAQLRDVRDFYIKREFHYKPMQPNVITDSTRFFFILERNDKTHVLSEGDYPVDSILAKMNDVMGY